MKLIVCSDTDKFHEAVLMCISSKTVLVFLIIRNLNTKKVIWCPQIPHSKILVMIVLFERGTCLISSIKKNDVDMNDKDHNAPTCVLIHHVEILCAGREAIRSNCMFELHQRGVWAFLSPFLVCLNRQTQEDLPQTK